MKRFPVNPTFLIGGILVAVAGLLGYHTFYARQVERAKAIQQEISQEHLDQEAQLALAPLLSQIDQYRKRLPPEPDPSWLVREIITQAEKVGVQIDSITQQVPQQLDLGVRLSVNLQIQASYHQLGSFLDVLENSESFVRVDHVELNSPTDGGMATIRLVMSTLYLPVIAGVGG